jgi:hypothetical protein
VTGSSEKSAKEIDCNYDFNYDSNYNFDYDGDNDNCFGWMRIAKMVVRSRDRHP